MIVLFRSYRKQMLIGAVVAMTIAGITPPTFNAAGYCWSEKRFLSRSELVSKAMEATFSLYPPSDYGGSGMQVSRPIYYASLKDFVLQNEGCCKVVSETDHQYRLSWFHKLQGRAAALVEVNFRVEAEPNAGAYTGLPEGYMRHYHVVTNCGQAWNGI